ncbi:Hypothetical protein YqaD [Bacillus subtilis subsp. subtilis str. BSP1]|nr:Hypothetical protein YqaD [Bacillus subtilis subsp. subtilis str. BSP1]
MIMASTTTISKVCELPSSFSRSFFSLICSLYFLCISSFFLSILLDPFHHKVKSSNSEISHPFLLTLNLIQSSSSAYGFLKWTTN